LAYLSCTVALFETAKGEWKTEKMWWRLPWHSDGPGKFATIFCLEIEDDLCCAENAKNVYSFSLHRYLLTCPKLK
jgi:hypothetical protein